MTKQKDGSEVIVHLAQLHSKYQTQKEKVKEEEDQLQILKQQHDKLLEVQKISQGVAEAVQESAHKQISDIVTRCLEAVFEGEGFAFSITFEQKRGKTEAKLRLTENGFELDPKVGTAGGVLDVASFALRLACLVLSRPMRSRILVMDEPFKFLDRKTLPRMASMLEVMADEMGIQIIMTTHSKILGRIGNVQEIE